MVGVQDVALDPGGGYCFAALHVYDGLCAQVPCSRCQQAAETFAALLLATNTPDFAAPPAPQCFSLRCSRSGCGGAAGAAGTWCSARTAAGTSSP